MRRALQLAAGPAALLALLWGGSPAVLAAQDSVDEVVAVVLGKEIRRGEAPPMDGERLQGIVLSALIERYAAEHDVEPTEAEIAAFIEALANGPSPVPMSPEQVREFASGMVRGHKILQSLYEAYGGRVIFQQMGPEPIDAFREFLEAQQEAGVFEIRDPSLEEGFWRYFVDDSMHSFYSPEEAEAVMMRPWWERPPDEEP